MTARQRNSRGNPSRWLLFAVVLFAFAWRTQGLEVESLWRDEVDAIYFALGSLRDLLSMFVSPAQNGALYFVFLRGWLRLVGSSEFALRYPAVLFGVMSVPLMWQVGRHLMPVKREYQGAAKTSQRPRGAWLFELLRLTMGSPAMLAALFLAVNPYQLWYAQDGKMYALATLLVLLSVWFWLRGIGQGGVRPWLGFMLTVSAAIYTHLLLVLLIPMFVVWFLIAWPQSRRHLAGFSIALAGLTLPYLPLVWWQWDLIAANEQRTAVAFIPLLEIVEVLSLEHIVGIIRPANRLWLAPVFLLGLTGLLIGYRAIAKRAPGSLPRLAAGRRHMLVASWLVVPVFGIALLSLRQPVFLPRYVIWIGPAVMMLVAIGIQLVWRNRARWARPLAGALAIYVVLFWGVVGWQEKALDFKPDLRGAVDYISQRRQPDDLLILQVPHLEIAYRYYSGDQSAAPFAGSEERLGWWVGGPMTNTAHQDDESSARMVAQDMDAATAGATNVWVMLSEDALWDRRGLLIEWLNRHAVLVDAADFHGAAVRLYRMPPGEETLSEG